MQRSIAFLAAGLVVSCGDARQQSTADAGVNDAAVVADASSYAANRSVSLNGTSQFASTGNTSLNIGLPATYEAWVRSATADSAQHIVVSERLTTNAYAPLQIQAQSGVWQCVFTNNSNQQVNLNTNVAVAVNTWTHLAFALSSTSADCYVNGVLAARQSLAITLPTNAKAGLAIGSGYQGVDGAFFSGLIDDVRVWSSYRSTDEIKNTMSRPLSGSESGLKAYWKFDDSFFDGTSNVFNLTGSGSPTFSPNVPY